MKHYQTIHRACTTTIYTGSFMVDLHCGLAQALLIGYRQTHQRLHLYEYTFRRLAIQSVYDPADQTIDLIYCVTGVMEAVHRAAFKNSLGRSIYSSTDRVGTHSLEMVCIACEHHQRCSPKNNWRHNSRILQLPCICSFYLFPKTCSLMLLVRGASFI